MTDASAPGSDAAAEDAATSPFAPPPAPATSLPFATPVEHVDASPFAPPPAGAATSPFAPPGTPTAPSPAYPPPLAPPGHHDLASYPPPAVAAIGSYAGTAPTAGPGSALPGYGGPGSAPAQPQAAPPHEPPPVAPIEGRRPPLWLAIGLIAVLLLPAVLHWALGQPDVAINDVLTQSFLVREIAIGVVLLAIMVAARYSRSVGWVPRPGAGAAVRLIAAGLVVTAFVAATSAAVELSLSVSQLLIVLVNVTAVGVVEETIFRGYLWAALPATWSASRLLLVTSLVFGPVHVLNGLVTGNWGAAVVQAAMACVLGLALGATRMRSGWLFLGVVVHAAIDGAAVVVGMLAPRFSDTQNPPLAPVLPLFAYFCVYVTFAITGIAVLVRTFRSERRARCAGVGTDVAATA